MSCAACWCRLLMRIALLVNNLLSSHPSSKQAVRPPQGSSIPVLSGWDGAGELQRICKRHN